MRRRINSNSGFLGGLLASVEPKAWGNGIAVNANLWVDFFFYCAVRLSKVGCGRWHGCKPDFFFFSSLDATENPFHLELIRGLVPIFSSGMRFDRANIYPNVCTVFLGPYDSGVFFMRFFWRIS